MFLKTVRLRNFRCFRDSGEIPIHRMTIFIGENDAGKTTILSAIGAFLNNENVTEDDFYQINGSRETHSSIELLFQLDDGESNIIDNRHIINEQFRIRKDYLINQETKNVVCKPHIYAHAFSDERLNNIRDLKADPLKDLCAVFGVVYKGVNQAKESLTAYINQNFELIPKVDKWIEVRWQEIATYLPQYEFYSKSTLSDPNRIVSNTLKEIYRKFFYDFDENGTETLKTEFKEREELIRKKLDEQIERQLLDKIRMTNEKIAEIKSIYQIDFAAGLALKDLLVDLGFGLNSINSIGDGSRTRLFLAITEWDMEVRGKEPQRRLIRCYDEPDASLHYDAQKKMFMVLKEVSENKNAKVQVIMCTHSLSMIDRASPSIINNVRHEDGKSIVETITGCEEEDVRVFLEGITSSLGIRNSSFFLERCFLIVEGETEAKALPIVYQTIMGKHLWEDGIVLVNLKTNSCWKIFLKLLSKNKSKCTILFLDADIQLDDRKNIDEISLAEIGFDSTFLKNNVILVGKKEFEDIFPDHLICECLNANWKKRDGDKWTAKEITNLRCNDKFSNALSKYVQDKVIWGKEITPFTKPNFGKAIVSMLSREELLEYQCFERLISLTKEMIK